MSASNQSYWNPDRIMRLIIGIGITTGLILLIRYLSHVLLPFFAACFIAYLLEPLVMLNRRIMHLKGRVLPVIATLVEVAGIITGIVFLFMPSVVSEMDMLGGILHDVSQGKRQLPQFYHTVIAFIDRYFDPDYLQTQFTPQHVEALLAKGSSIIQQSIDLIMHTLEWLLALIYIVFIMMDYPQITRGFKMIIPGKYRTRGMAVVRDVQTSMNHYFRGQGLVALCAMVLYCVGFKIVGMPLAIPMGILVGVLYMIPYFQYVTLLPVAAICFIYSMGGEVDFGVELGKCLLVYVVSQCTCDYIITPRVMGKEMGLNAAIILLSLSVWGSLIGIIGMIIALPVTALIMSYYERYISNPASKSTQLPKN
ncbi:MAG: AI-2E family transporter [Bacteroidales bacterium]|nr:AI-2E family transporter [Bacteroidales bacterium]